MTERTESPARLPAVQNMDHHQSASALVFLLAAGNLAFLLALVKGRLPERRQTAIWIGFTLVFFFICSILVRANSAQL